MMRFGGMLRPVARSGFVAQPQWMGLSSRDYTVARDETTTRVITVVKAFDKVRSRFFLFLFFSRPLPRALAPGRRPS